MRVIFMGTPDFALAPLAEIFGRGHDIVAVYTRAPKAAGRRGLELTPSPVHAAAQRYGLTVLTPKNFRDPETIEQFRAFEADVAVVVAYGLILPKAVLDAPALGCLNLHGSLLPRWRGAAPIQRAIMAGDRETGVEVMKMEEGLDTGPIAMAEKLAITPDMTAGEAHDKLSALGADLIGRALAALERGGLQFQPQAEQGVLYAKKIDKAEARVDFSRPAADLHNLIRGLSPFPGAFFEMDFGKGFRARENPALSRLRRARENPAKFSTRRRSLPAARAPCVCSRCKGPGAARSRARNSCAARGSPPARSLPRLKLPQQMPRYKLVIEYDGTAYVGWQRQANGLSVQEVIESALARLDPEPGGLRGAGRTDAGVHASAQVGHVDLSREWRPDKLREALNAQMRPEKVAILLAEAAPDDFDARFSAKARHYLYRIVNRRAPLTYRFRPGLAGQAAARFSEAMHEAAQLLLGRHDFSTFRDSDCQAENPVRTLDRLDVRRAGDEVHVYASARAFLHRQVRSMVGSLEHVGSGKWRAERSEGGAGFAATARAAARSRPPRAFT